MRVVQLNLKDWAHFSEKSHLITFHEHKPLEMERIDFALVVERGNSEMIGYVTCREIDAHTVYWQFGGAYPSAKNSSLSYSGYRAFVEYCGKKYQRITTLIENHNIVMLKMAMKVGFLIVGVRVFRGHVLLEHLLEFPC